MSNPNEEENTGPSVDSDDPEERILARRLRIQKRQEAQKRALLGEDHHEAEVVEQPQSISQKQMEESHVRLRKLHEDGFEMVTNIRVAGDAREIARRVEDEEARRQRKEKLEAEAKAGAERFEEITKKWDTSLQKEIPQDLHEMLTHQKTACDAMLDEKNKLITDYQAELKAKDDQYVRDLKKQAEDIDLLIERMENQIKELSKAYRHELEEIERAFVMERTEMLEQHNKKWEHTMAERRQKEIDNMTEREKRVEDYEEQLNQLRTQDAEEYNQIKIKLETDVQILQQQLQQMKATYQLNQEKLEYNFQVLRKRDEENSITKSQQKRKITRLHDVLTNLQRKQGKQEKLYKDENQQLTVEYKHQLGQFKEVQKKARTFMCSDAKKFNEIWEMNEEECKQLANRALEADKIIHEQQLGLPWTPPSLDFMSNVGPIVSAKDQAKTEMSAKKLAHQVISAEDTSQEEAVMGIRRQQTDSQHQDGQSNEESSATSISDGTPMTRAHASSIAKTVSPQVIRRILELLCDESGFLIESKLLSLLAPLQPSEQTLMKLDAIFMAMGIESEEDIQLLSRFFLKHSNLPGNEVANDGDETAASDEYDPEESQTSNQDGRDQPSSQLIEANDVLKALRAFVEQTNKHRASEKSEMANQFTIVNINERDDSEDADYWEQFKRIITPDKEKVWDALIYSFNKYYDVLVARSKLIEETDGLRHQNSELRLLLHQYVHSKVNQELEIPPTRILQLNQNPM